MSARRQIRLVLALLLPLMLLRALLPPGYMPVVREGELHIVMCSAGMVLPASGDAAADDSPGDHQLPPNAGDCPFAHAAVFAPPLRHLVEVVAAPRLVRFVPRPGMDLPPGTGPPRQTAARAPPRPPAFV